MKPRLNTRLFRLVSTGLAVIIAGLACNAPSLVLLDTPSPTTPPTAAPSANPTPASPTAVPTGTPLPTIVYTPIFEAADCQFYVPEGYAPECGYLNVPEDRTNPNSATIRLHVAIFRSSSPDRVPDPVIHLTGGPGSHGLQPVWYYLSSGHTAFLDKRDYIVFDQRGVGTSQPALDCSDEEGFSGCRERLTREGINLAMYNSAASAADVQDLRRALGYEQVNLYGVSYGTRLALTVMRDHPEGIRSVILDSVYPPQVNLYTAWAPNAARVFQMTFDACAVDPTCSSRYPNLENTFYALVDELNDQPVSVVVETANGTTTIQVDGDQFLDVFFVGHYRADVIPLLPKLVFDTRDGEYDLLQGRLQAQLSGTSSLGMRNSVQCYEEIPFSSYDDVLASAGGLPEQLGYFATRLESLYQVCETWGAGDPPPAENQPVASDIPTLILAGAFDPITPPEWAYISASTLSSSVVYEFPNAGHWVLRSGPCGWEIALAFLDNPGGVLDSSCLSTLGPPVFQ